MATSVLLLALQSGSIVVNYYCISYNCLFSLPVVYSMIVWISLRSIKCCFFHCFQKNQVFSSPIKEYRTEQMWWHHSSVWQLLLINWGCSVETKSARWEAMTAAFKGFWHDRSICSALWKYAMAPYVNVHTDITEYLYFITIFTASLMSAAT